MTGLDELYCTGYKINGSVIKNFPDTINVKVQPIYKNFIGWKVNINKKIYNELPKEVINHIDLFQNFLMFQSTLFQTPQNR